MIDVVGVKNWLRSLVEGSLTQDFALFSSFFSWRTPIRVISDELVLSQWVLTRLNRREIL
jgi:hypothetical protein